MYFRLNEELRWTLPWKSMRAWQIVQFFDWARVVDVIDPRFADSQEGSLGAGIRYHWQFLTFRLDCAILRDLTSNNEAENYKSANKHKYKGFWSRFAFDLSQAF